MRNTGYAAAGKCKSVAHGKLIVVRHELALRPGLAVVEDYPDSKEGKIKLDGGKVVECPRLPEMQQVTLKVLRWEERDKHLVIKEYQTVGRAVEGRRRSRAEPGPPSP